VKIILNLGVLASMLVGFGCATAAAPPELVGARTAYDRASHGPASQWDPTDLHTAKESLDEAEQAFLADGDTLETRDLGYTAQRRTETAETRARTLAAVANRDQILARMHATTADSAQRSAAQLGRANQELATEGAKLQSEVQRRQEAERRAAQARADLAKFASVQQEARGMVITLSGSVMFVSNKADLLPAAQVKLNDVANALTQQDPESKIVVEGHTDSQGTASANQDLSQRRAESVRAYLVSRGISADRLSAAGFGPTRPIADNGSPEGRANNRRVEIVVQPTR
jgi:outer membrane protein OmpA-like peptidoglycan-associated protein